MNNIPNKVFWDELPTLCKDGIAFLQSGGQKTVHYSQYAASGNEPLNSKPPKKPKSKKKDAAPVPVPALQDDDGEMID